MSENNDSKKQNSNKHAFFKECIRTYKIGDPNNLITDIFDKVLLKYNGHIYSIFDYLLLLVNLSETEMKSKINLECPEILKEYNPEDYANGKRDYLKVDKLNTPTGSIRMVPKVVNRIRTAKQRLLDAKDEPSYVDLFGKMVQSGRITILFADTATGKSLIATRIAMAVANGEPTIFGQKSVGYPVRTLYYDCENSDKEFEKRFVDSRMNDNLFISSAIIKNKFGELDKEKLIEDIESVKADFIVLDNITYSSLDSTTDTDSSLKIMNIVVEIKKELGVSILIIAHVPKIGSFTKLTLNSLGGSKMISNFSDSVIAMGKTRLSSTQRYLSHIKRRGAAESDEVIVLEIIPTDGDLNFEYVGTSTEEELIAKESKYSDDVKLKAKELRNSGLSIAKISLQLGVPQTTINNWVGKK